VCYSTTETIILDLILKKQAALMFLSMNVKNIEAEQVKISKRKEKRNMIGWNA
jgi:hypothetical protein